MRFMGLKSCMFAVAAFCVTSQAYSPPPKFAVCGDAGTGDCCMEGGNGTPFCNDADCCHIVCAVDPFCCEICWDSPCAGQAEDLCELCGCPWDCDSGESIDGTVGIVDLLTLLAQWGSPGSCDFDGGGVGITDFLDLLAHWGACP